ncbi:MAG: hypothetical protein OHK93_001746, partial [Ramalina farinacea]|nr:hypothetical protein [Ramalina farinacea]
MLNPRQSKDATIFGVPLYGSNPWVFSGCNAQQGPALEDFFNKTADFMKAYVVPAVGLNSSTDAYPAFFSTMNPDFVSPIFKWFDPTLYLSNGRPNIICLNDDVPALAGALAVCSQGKDPYAFTISTNIFLCPAFFDKLKAFPEGPANCPSVDATVNPAQFVDHNDAVVNQYGVLIHELVHVNSHVRISNDPATENNATEVYGLNEIIALSAGAQQLNANNYAYFAA